MYSELQKIYSSTSALRAFNFGIKSELYVLNFKNICGTTEIYLELQKYILIQEPYRRSTSASIRNICSKLQKCICGTSKIYSELRKKF